MTRVPQIVVVVAALVACLPSPVAGDDSGDGSVLNCGGVATSNASWQFADMRVVELLVQTRREPTVCPLEVQAEAWVNGAPYGAHVNRGSYVAEVHSWVPVPSWGTWQTYGKHWLIWWFGAEWNYLGTSVSFANVNAPPPPDPRHECELMGGTWDYGAQICQFPNCPLIVDTNHDGYRLTSVDAGVRFDLDSDGTAEQIAWTEADSDEAFLALDRNGNGRIDDGSELFGNFSPAYADEAKPTALNGFEALKFAEGPTFGSSRADFVIDARDAVFGRLLLWRDVNHNGVSEQDELTPVATTDLLAIDTHYKVAGRRDRYGNEYRQRAKGTWRQGSFYIYDIWLKSR